MKRVVLIFVLIGLSALSAGTALAGPSGRTSPSHVVAAKKIHCPKGKHVVKNKKGKQHCVKTKKHKATPTPVRAVAATATPTNTPTPTPTATATFTPTPSPTPSPSYASMVVRVDVALGYRVGMFLCGLPLTAAASFSPNPAIASSDPSSPTLASAKATLTVGVPPGITPGTYDLNLNAYFENPGGTRVTLPPGGVYLVPRGVTLTVDGSGNASLAAGSFDPNVPQANCTQPPAGFAPNPTPTPSSQNVTVVASLSRTRPSPGQLDTVSGTITVNGQPVAGVPMHTNWYLSYGMQTCDGVTGTNGTASCTIALGQFLPGQRYDVVVSFLLNGQNYSTVTSLYS